jgi:hypothetical protein
LIAVLLQPNDFHRWLLLPIDSRQCRSRPTALPCVTKIREYHDVVGLGLLADAPLLLWSAVHDRYFCDLHDHNDVDDARSPSAAVLSIF